MQQIQMCAHQISTSLTVILKYMKSNGKQGTNTFSKVQLADGQKHHIMLHFGGLQQGTPTTTLYVDCSLVERVNDVPVAFKSLPQGSKRVTLKTLQTSSQVIYNFHSEGLLV